MDAGLESLSLAQLHPPPTPLPFLVSPFAPRTLHVRIGAKTPQLVSLLPPQSKIHEVARVVGISTVGGPTDCNSYASAHQRQNWNFS